MTIFRKITFLIVILIVAIAVNSAVAMRQMDLIRRQLDIVAGNDRLLFDAVNQANWHQMQRSLIAQKLISVAEEMAFTDTPYARKSYLNDSLVAFQGEFQRLSQVIESRLREANRYAATPMDVGGDFDKRRDIIAKIVAGVQGLEVSRQKYETIVGGIFNKVIAAQGYQINLDDTDMIAQNEVTFSNDVTRLMADSNELMRIGMAQAMAVQEATARVMRVTVLVSVCLAFILGLWIMMTIHRRLANLKQTAKDIANGHFDASLPVMAGDEFDDVLMAFGRMKDQIGSDQKRLAQQNVDLARHVTELDRFAHTISHDIAGPLTTIVGYGAHLERHYLTQLDDKGKECVLGVRKGTARMNSLVKDLLELTKMSRIKAPFKPVNMQEVFADAKSNFTFVIADRNVQIIEPAQWPIVMGDQIKLTVAVSNILGNAIKFSSAQGQSPRVEIKCVETPTAHEIAICDNGIGIDPKDHQVIFDLFKRLNGAQQFEGNGAGLAIAHAAITDHGGDIRVESKLNHGACFILCLPKKQSI